MATLQHLKHSMNQLAEESEASTKRPLSDAEYSDAYEMFLQGPGWLTYQDFIIPELSRLLSSTYQFKDDISILEIGPGPKSVIAYLSEELRRKIARYAAYEPNQVFAKRMNEWLSPTSDKEQPLPALKSEADILQSHFSLQDECEIIPSHEKYDIVLFCHSMYGMNPNRKFIEKSIELLVREPHSGVVVVFHRGGVLQLDDLVSHESISFPNGTVRAVDNDEALDRFASFITGFNIIEIEANTERRQICRNLGARDEAHPDHLLFNAPEIMQTFTCHATALPELVAQLPVREVDRVIKNRKARLHHSASIIRPTSIPHIQRCVRWAIQHKAKLTVIGGGHSDHCLWPDSVAIDMSAFDQIDILDANKSGNAHITSEDNAPLVVAESGCIVGNIIEKMMAVGLTVPFGSRPSVGAGLWLQGGIGHLSRLHGLSCDAIVGAIVVCVKSGRLLYVGHVPSKHRPVEAICPDNQADLLWAIKGAGTNFGVVVSVVFKAYVARKYSVLTRTTPLNDAAHARGQIQRFDEHIASRLEKNCSADAYLFWENDHLKLGVTTFQSFTEGQEPFSAAPILGSLRIPKIMNAIELFDAEMYMSGMHGGHAGGKTSSFKRCVLLKDIGDETTASRLVAAIQNRPSPLCYLHLLQGGGAVNEVKANATAFGCRDWSFACVVTGVWPRDEDSTAVARCAEKWVYDVVHDLLPFSVGVYDADLGPDPRDKALVKKAFGSNLPRLMGLKHSFDPLNVLAYTSPIPKASAPKTVILVTGKSGAGKDYCAKVWVSVLNSSKIPKTTARVVSISDVTKREYAASSGADYSRLLEDREYKEMHRPTLTRFFQGRVQKHPRLPEEHFVNVIHDAADVDVLFITGLRDEAPVANLSHLVPECKLIEVHVEADEKLRRHRLGNPYEDHELEDQALSHHPYFTFTDNKRGSKMAKDFAQKCLLPLFHQDFDHLASMVRKVSDFPRPGIDFRHVLGIPQQPHGLSLCTSLLQKRFDGDWTKVSAIVSCEVGGIIYASALASRVQVPFVLVRKTGKLPPPVVSVCKPVSHISSLQTIHPEGERIEIERDAIPKGGKVVVVDDVLSTGRTLCAVVELLDNVGVDVEDISVMVVAEFPIHRGRKRLYQQGHGRVNVQSLLVFDTV